VGSLLIIGCHVDAAPRFLRTDYTQYNPQVPTGLKGFMDTFQARFAQKLPDDYKRELLNGVGEDNMVVIYVRPTWTSHDGQHHQALGFRHVPGRRWENSRNTGVPINLKEWGMIVPGWLFYAIIPRRRECLSLRLSVS
jgi:predicted SnoaL-like aldol condensation-catalyzing enzyme